MYSISDLCWSLLIGICFIFMFLLQKKIFPQKYFSMSQIILDGTATWHMLLVRVILIFVFATVAQFIFKDSSIVLLGVVIGSFLIVWPVFANPTQLYMDNPRGVEALLFLVSYLVFIVTSFSIAYFALSFFPEVTNFTLQSFKDYAKDNFWPIMFLLFGGPGQGKIGQVLDKKIVKRCEREREEYFEEMSESEDQENESERNVQ